MKQKKNKKLELVEEVRGIDLTRNTPLKEEDTAYLWLHLNGKLFIYRECCISISWKDGNGELLIWLKERIPVSLYLC